MCVYIFKQLRLKHSSQRPQKNNEKFVVIRITEIKMKTRVESHVSKKELHEFVGMGDWFLSRVVYPFIDRLEIGLTISSGPPTIDIVWAPLRFVYFVIFIQSYICILNHKINNKEEVRKAIQLSYI